MSEHSSLINALQTHGLRLVDPRAGHESRRGGAGPSDHKAVTIGETTVMVPVHTAPSFESPFLAEAPDAAGRSRLTRDGREVATLRFPARPRFYDLKTADGVPYSHIATLHSRDVLATTVLQTCIRYESRKKTCQFCAIGQSLAAGRTIARKTPAQLAEVAKAAVELDGVRHMVLTTGTPPGKDRGAAVLAESAAAIKAAVDLPLQGQCEPPEDDAWHQRMFDAGIDTLGMHLEAVTPEVRARIMPGKASVPLEKYFSSFEAAVKVFGRGQVSTYILAGLGDTAEDILAMGEKLCAMGVYPFVVPFVPISGTPLESHPAPDGAFMASILAPLGRMIAQAGIRSADMKAGCGKCGACSALSTYEKLGVPA
ncbi:MSMEG_0568 family radical SAM protein [Albimonas pacifica]|uniref:Radical SAM protein, MSMEG_0568 family n=1 Tax=Albimonas pacifica TaxID=1114924 RepID=A0A1I3J1E5_9RHOB|nr:MSMEG_0568 family radical SAM protein [Albimonas pacifica]SFI54019.1 radical SAM protein, MSMEG_0568 family [Albimonas pacifica]